MRRLARLRRRNEYVDGLLFYLQRKRLVGRLARLRRRNEYEMVPLSTVPAEEEAGEEVGEAEEEE